MPPALRKPRPLRPPTLTTGPAGLRYSAVMSNRKCADLRLDIVNTEAECIGAGRELGYGTSNVVERHDRGDKPAGCFDFTGNGGHQLEFNTNWDSTWAGGRIDIFQICRVSPLPPRAYSNTQVFSDFLFR